jgi:hypothetical protein
MVRLNSTDAAILARVAKYPSVGVGRRRHMLEKASQEAKAIGDVLITGNEAGVAADYVRAAQNIREWADAERPENIEIPAYARR